MNSTSSVYNACLVDSNVLVYLVDPRDKDKQQRASDVFVPLVEKKAAVVSVQCLNEFFNTALHLPEPVPHDTALRRVEDFASSCTVVDLTAAVSLEACRAVVAHKMSLWDALIWAVAKLNQIPCILTEDEHGPSLEGIRYLNPFAPDFDMALLRY